MKTKLTTKEKILADKILRSVNETIQEDEILSELEGEFVYSNYDNFILMLNEEELELLKGIV